MAHRTPGEADTWLQSDLLYVRERTMQFHVEMA